MNLVRLEEIKKKRSPPSCILFFLCFFFVFFWVLKKNKTSFLLHFIDVVKEKKEKQRIKGARTRKKLEKEKKKKKKRKRKRKRKRNKTKRKVATFYERKRIQFQVECVRTEFYRVFLGVNPGRTQMKWVSPSFTGFLPSFNLVSVRFG